MPTVSKKTKGSPAKRATPEKSSLLRRLQVRQEAFLARRPHRSFRLTRRRDYTHPVVLPGVLSFTGEVTRTLWRHKKMFTWLAVLYALLYAVLVGMMSQDTYGTLSSTLREAGSQVIEGEWGALPQASGLLLSIVTTGIGSGGAEAQQVFTVLIFLMVWLTTVWLLRNILAGHKVKLRDGLYNAGTPLFAMIVIVLFIIVQLLPVGIAMIGYSAADATGLLSGGAPTMLFWLAAGLLVVLSIFWVTSSLFAMIIVSLPGMYPYQAIRTAGDMVLGRRVKILLRWFWMAVVVAVSWIVVLIPVILLDMWLKNAVPAIDWLPVVPLAVLVMSSLTVVWVSAYVYLLYRKVVDYVSE